jgi:hypothetical protein
LQNSSLILKRGNEMSQQEAPANNSAEENVSQAPPLDIWGVMRYCLMLLHSQAWQALGLMPNPATGKVEQDLAQAQVAIDAVAYLGGQLEAKLSGPELREMKNLVADLRMNFVNQQSAGAVSDSPSSQ